MVFLKSTITAALAFSLTATGLASSATAAGCVSQAEFAKVKNGMSVSRVAALTGTNGTRSVYSKSGSYSFEVRSYKACTQFGVVSIGYTNGLVASKTGVF
jgi:hypothetical protein